MSLPAQSSAVAVLVRLRRTEQERDAPDSGEGDERVDYTRYHRALTAAYPRDDVEAEQTDASPVERADNGEHEGDLIHNHIIFLREIIVQSVALAALYIGNTAQFTA